MTSDAGAVSTASTVGTSGLPGGLRLYVVGEHGVATRALPATGSLTLGRGGDCDVVIDDTSVSRLHAVLHLGATLEIEDRGSHNGTRIGERVVPGGERRPVLAGEVVHLGNATLVVYDPAPPRARHLWPHGYFELLVGQECARAAATARSFALVRIRTGAVAAAAVVVDAIHQVLRDTDVLGGYGPDEYEVLLVEVEPGEARATADRIAAVLQARGATPRIGVASYPRDGRDPATLIARAAARIDGESPRDRPARPAGSTIDQVRAVMERVAATSICVLVLGETGAGKEVLARTLHARSPRQAGPFLPVRCGGLSAELFESELFGHVKGSFTGAIVDKPGLLASAAGGTVFLDEIGELAEALQAKLLRVLEDRAARPVGATEPQPLDVRFVAASHRDLEAEVARGAFRADLFFRLSGVTLVVPPLRHRVDDIEELAREFCDEAAARLGRPVPAIAVEALVALEAYAWPGNVRELRNTIERAVVLCDGATIEADDLPLDKMAATVQPVRPARPAARRIDDEAEKARVVDVLARCNGNQTKAAAELGYSLRKLVYLMTRYELPRPRKRGPAPP